MKVKVSKMGPGVTKGRSTTLGLIKDCQVTAPESELASTATLLSDCPHVCSFSSPSPCRIMGLFGSWPYKATPCIGKVRLATGCGGEIGRHARHKFTTVYMH